MKDTDVSVYVISVNQYVLLLINIQRGAIGLSLCVPRSPGHMPLALPRRLVSAVRAPLARTPRSSS